jgi:hypothetical protein
MKKLLFIALAVLAIGCGKKDVTTDQTTTTTTTDASGSTTTSTDPKLPPGMPPIETQKSSLIVTNSLYTITPAKRVDSSIVELECGCHFDFIVENYMGDTNDVKYKQFDAKTAQSHRVGIEFTGSPKAPKGTHEVKLAFLSTGSKGDYRDTITVMYKL